MKKESIIAIMLGLLLGGIVAVVMILRTGKKEKAKVIPVAPAAQSVTTAVRQPTKPATTLATISQPEDNSITDTNTVTIKGKAAKESLIIIQSPIRHITLQNKTDTFSTDFPLGLGENVINVSVYTKDSKGIPDEHTLHIYYLTE